MIQNLWDATKPVLRGKFIAIQSYLKKQEKSQINNLTYHLKIRKIRINKAKSHPMEGNNKIREEIYKIEIKKTTGMINETKSCFFFF